MKSDTRQSASNSEPTQDNVLKSLAFPVQYLEIAESLARKLGIDAGLIYQRCGIDLPRPFMPWQTINGKQLKLALAYFLHLCPPGRPPLVTFMEHFPVTAHGPLGMLALTSANLDEAWQGVVQYAELVMPACKIYRMDIENDIHTIIKCPHDFGEVDAFFTEMVVAAPLKIASFLTRPIKGGTVYLKHAALGNSAEYEAAFGLKFVFNAQQNKIVLPRESMSVALISRCRAAHLLMKATLEQQAQSHTPLKPLTDKVKRHLHTAMVQQQLLGINAQAKTLSMSSRTLSRKLKKEGITFSQLRTEVGIAYAEVLLLETNKKIAQVAIASGFDSSASFCRVFRRVNGSTPSKWRTEYHMGSV